MVDLLYCCKCGREYPDDGKQNPPLCPNCGSDSSMKCYHCPICGEDYHDDEGPVCPHCGDWNGVRRTTVD